MAIIYAFVVAWKGRFYPKGSWKDNDTKLPGIHCMIDIFAQDIKVYRLGPLIF